MKDRTLERAANLIASISGRRRTSVDHVVVELSVTPRAGDEQRDLGNWHEAAIEYKRYLDKVPNDAAITVQLGHALKESGQYKAALAAYRSAAILAPNDADIFLQMGHLAKVMGDEVAMITGYTRAFELDPDLNEVYKELLAYAPRTSRGWSRALFEGSNGSPSNLAPPNEPVIRAASPAGSAVEDSIRAAMDTKRVARAIRQFPIRLPLSTIEQNYALSKFGVFNSTYGDAAGVFAALAGLSGAWVDQPVDPTCLFAFGAVPSRRADPRMTRHANRLLQNYQSMQLAATERLMLRPDLKCSVTTGPLISVLLPVYKGPSVYLERAILSVLLQTYQNIQLCIVDDYSQSRDVTALLSYYAEQDPRVSLVVHEANLGIAEATNSALNIAVGDYVALLDHDDMLAYDALELIASRINDDPRIDLLYTDECKIDGDDIVEELFTKPDWSPVLLTSVMYTGHLSVYKRKFVDKLGRFRSQFNFSQDYDLALRAAEASPRVVHLAECLYGWRMIAGSAAQGEKPMARLSNVGSLQAAADRRGLHGTAIGLQFSNRIHLGRPSEPPLVSLIIPSDNENNIAATLASLKLMTSYPNFEIIVVTNSECGRTCERKYAESGARYIDYDMPYNFSDKCNYGARAASGRYLVFFNDDVRVIDEDWLDAIIEAFSFEDVAIVGPKLLYENGGIQHGGMVTGVRGLVGTAFHSFPDKTTAHFCFAQSAREVSLICGACLAIKADVFVSVGGFDAVNTPIAHSDVDLCFKVREAGFSCVYTPHTKLTHIGHLSIGEAKKTWTGPAKKDKADIYLLRRWGKMCSYDPYFPPGMRDIIYHDSIEYYQLHVGGRSVVAGGRDILIVSHDLSASGAPKVAFDIAKCLVSEGNYVLVVSPEDGPFRSRYMDIGADVIIDPLCASGENRDFFALAKNFDVVIVNTVVLWPVCNQLAQATNVFWYVHETELVNHIARHNPAVGREAGSLTVWAGSHKAANALESIGVSSTVIEYGVEPWDFDRVEAHRDKVVISVMGTYEPRKGQDLALLAFQLLPDSVRESCELRFAGRVNDKVFYEAIVEIGRGEACVRHLGELTLHDYVGKMSETDIVLCPSRDDTLPLVSLDALANGKILICTSETGTSAYVRSGESGYVSASGAPPDIAEALRWAIMDRDEWPNISVAARRVFEENFSMPRFRARIMQEFASKGVAIE
ncbi:glycosyltransferase [Segnochrobactrum spirostomi]|uniref:Glycosyltransferase n=1 Tax=Segnochrobactrum spirostomi TaxID=2608987 RepID=A0A6A7Y7J6_9HYPH|nr:glycosyltransferase [Segnochrobactrum spirostomi]MQT15284.1 glycosyltransferase [Segnochrobactrum spirostomi]